MANSYGRQTQKNELFCSLCDHAKRCIEPSARNRWVNRDWCGWSSIQKERVETSMRTIVFGGQRYSREDQSAISALMQAIAKAKPASEGPAKPAACPACAQV
ncbi:MAG: hypothetical protein PHV13_05895 [Candidatus ainarchaeum sp.]|nr:hypothetical protein [Candidatus ainarchaeum sp.]